MPKLIFLLPLLLLLSACSTLRDSASVNDGVYDIPEPRAIASTGTGDGEGQTQSNVDDYYDSIEATRSNDSYRDYYDMTYNDPYYYNYGRFGFGSGIGGYGPAYSMGFSYGWPTSFGSMSVGYGMGYGSTWNSGWGPGYGYDPYGYYSSMGYGYGYGYGPYQNAWGSCVGCYEPTSYTPVVYSHRPSMNTGSSTSGPTPSVAPRMMRNPASLLTPPPPTQMTRSSTEQNRQIAAPSVAPSLERERTAPSRSTIGVEGGSRSGGTSNGGGGRITSPRPR